MLELMRAGGVSMWVVAVAGIAALGTAVAFALNRSERTLGVVRPLSLATIFAALSGVSSALATTFHRVAAMGTSADRPLLVMLGIGESMAPAILGFALLTAVWLFVAVGMRRQH